MTIDSFRKIHGEPFRDAVLRLAQKGLNRHNASKVLGMGQTHFYECCDRFGLTEAFMTDPLATPKTRQIAGEFDEPFEDVVQGFAEMKFSKTSTARALGFTRQYFGQLLKKYGLQDIFPPQGQMRRESRPGGPSKPPVKKLSPWQMTALHELARGTADFHRFKRIGIPPTVAGSLVRLDLAIKKHRNDKPYWEITSFGREIMTTGQIPLYQ